MVKKEIVKEVVSPKYSFKGFKLSKNIIDAGKNVLYILIPAIITELATSNTSIAVSVATVSPFVLKALEYWIKEK